MLVFTVSRRIKNNNKKRKLENEQYFTKVSNNGNANEKVSEEPHDIMSELDWTGMGEAILVTLRSNDTTSTRTSLKK